MTPFLYVQPNHQLQSLVYGPVFQDHRSVLLKSVELVVSSHGKEVIPSRLPVISASQEKATVFWNEEETQYMAMPLSQNIRWHAQWSFVSVDNERFYRAQYFHITEIPIIPIISHQQVVDAFPQLARVHRPIQGCILRSDAQTLTDLTLDPYNESKYLGSELRILSGKGHGQSFMVIGFDKSLHTVTLDASLNDVVSGDRYEIIPSWGSVIHTAWRQLLGILKERYDIKALGKIANFPETHEAHRLLALKLCCQASQQQPKDLFHEASVKFAKEFNRFFYRIPSPENHKSWISQSLSLWAP